MMSFETEHEKWIKHHMALRQGERKDALKRGHGYGNQMFVKTVWWPLMRQFTHLHPEYEVKDARGRSYFVDFMWKLGGYRFVFEIMDYGSHGKDRTKYRMDLNRALFLQALEYQVLLISFDEMKENPRFIQNMLRSILAPYIGTVPDEYNKDPHTHTLGKIERQLIRFAIRNNRIVRPASAAIVLELHKQTVIKYCRQLVQKGKFRAVCTGKSGKVYYYEYVGIIQNPVLF